MQAVDLLVRYGKPFKLKKLLNLYLLKGLQHISGFLPKPVGGIKARSFLTLPILTRKLPFGLEAATRCHACEWHPEGGL